MKRNKDEVGEMENSMRYARASLLLFFFIIVATGLLLPGFAKAQEGWGPGQDKWKFALGGYFPSVSSDMKVDINDTEIDLEESLGLSENDALWRLDGYWRFAKKHRLGFGYYGFDRDATKALDKELVIGGEPWYVGALVQTEWTMDFYTLSYAYSFYQGEKWEIAGTIGAYWVRFKASLALAAGLDNGVDPPLVVGDRVESETFEGPLPLFGLAFDYYITPKWMVTLKGAYFQLSINEFTGKILNLGANVEYQFTKLFGLGLGYDGFRLNVEAADKGSFAEVDYNYSGVQVYGILRF